MSDDLPLFAEPEPDRPPKPATEPAAADWQIDLLRKALDARGLTAMDERKRAVEGAVGRSVESLRTLTGQEALTALTSLSQERPQAARRQPSTWDDREEDTWIDRL